MWNMRPPRSKRAASSTSCWRRRIILQPSFENSHIVTSRPDWNRLADQALAGEIISREDALATLRAPDDALLDQLAAAYRVRRHYYGNRVRLHFLLNAQSGLCPEDCHYCSQSAVSVAEIEKYPFMAREKILAAADRAASLGVGTFCMVI